MTKVRTRNPKKLRRAARAGRGVPSSVPAPAAAPPADPRMHFSLLAKPIGPACNLRCRYCFYLEKDAFFPRGEDYRMSDEVLDAYVRKYIASTPAGQVDFHWQGGEPTLMGLDFFRKVVALQRRYAGAKRITNSLQTNGTLLDDEWGRFLAQNGWLVGLSLDGPQEIHDIYRLDVEGKGSFPAVKRGLEALLRNNVEFNVLASVTAGNSVEPLRVYRFLRDSGVKFVQFIPIVERLADDAAHAQGLQLAVGMRSGQAIAAPQLTPWSVKPEVYGEFLCRIFDEWVRHDVGAFFVMNFEWALSAYMGQSPGVCYFMPVCGHSPIIEHNGDIYACDHYVYPEYRLGNILTDDLQSLMQSKFQCDFGMAKHRALPRYCRECRMLSACYGECPKRRFMTSPDGEPGLNYLCAGYKMFFEHAAPYFEAMKRLWNSGEPFSKIMETEIYLMPRSSGLPKSDR